MASRPLSTTRSHRPCRHATSGRRRSRSDHATKRFGGVIALDDVSVSVSAGEVIALLGDNGAGKSTLIKCLSGVHAPRRGDDRNGRAPRADRFPGGGAGARYRDRLPGPRAVRQSRSGGQFLRRSRTRRSGLAAALPSRPQAEGDAVVDRRHPRPSAGDAAAARMSVGLMSGGQRQAVAVARAAAFASRVVILDEPTAALGVRESRSVLDLIARLRDRRSRRDRHLARARSRDRDRRPGRCHATWPRRGGGSPAPARTERGSSR